MRYAATFLAALLLFTSLSACATVSPYGEATQPKPEVQAYVDALLEKSPETLTEEEQAFLLLYAQQAEARNTQAQAQFEQGVFFVSGGLTLLSTLILVIDRVL
ncbi:MAG: hypothetical protein ACR2GR_10320 [Rhodothermales bacterium]